MGAFWMDGRGEGSALFLKVKQKSHCSNFNKPVQLKSLPF